jgi:cell division protein ZapA
LKEEAFVQGDGKNRLTVEIYGQQYRLSGKASINHMRMIAGFVNDKMTEIAKMNPRLDTAKIAVLSAVNIADDYARLRLEYEELLRLLQEDAKGNNHE